MGKRYRRNRHAHKTEQNRDRLPNYYHLSDQSRDHLLGMVARVTHLLAEKQTLLLAGYRKKLEQNAYRLTSETGQTFLYENLAEARAYGIDEELRSLVRFYTAQFVSRCAEIKFPRLLTAD